MIKVKVYSVDISDCEVGDSIKEYENWEDLIIELEEEYDEEDINGESIRDLDQGNAITIQGDSWFKVYRLISAKD
jgi:hypothetical protein